MADISIPAPDANGYWHFTYITTDPVDGRWYGGRRSTKRNPLTSRYLGSGNWVRDHPARARLQRRIVAFYANSAEVCAAEAEMITWDHVFDDPLCMNLRDGGEGTTIEAARILVATEAWRTAHAAGVQRMFSSPEYRAKNADALRRMHADPKWQAANMAANRRKATDPKWKDANAAANRRTATDPEWLEKTAARNRFHAKDPQWLETNAAAVKRRSADSKHQEATSVGIARRSMNIEWRENQKAAMVRLWADPEHRAKQAAATAEKNRRLWSDPEFRAKHTAAMRRIGAAKRAAKALNASK